MDDLNEVVSRLSVPTEQITSETLQDVLIKAKKQSKLPKQDVMWCVIVEKLWGHIQNGLIKVDDQLLCSTCLYSVLHLTDKTPFYLETIQSIITHELECRSEHINNHMRTLGTVSIVYGMFQSAFLTLEPVKDGGNGCLSNILASTFDLLLSMAYEYSRYTYIVFKTMNSYKKVIGSNLEKFIFNKNCQIRLLNLVNHNWENPITGIRDLNRGIFQTLLSVTNEEMSNLILKELNEFYWNKAKYLMLSEIIEHKSGIKKIVQQYDWVNGLLYSLYKPGLVSAGADMYFSILKQLQSEDLWCDIFLQGVIKVLAGTSSKAIENFSNYWCLNTLKRFPVLASKLLNELETLQDSEQKMYSSVYLLKQANKLGLTKKEWGSGDFENQESMVLCGLEHCNPHIRMLSFDFVCVINSKLLPAHCEYELVIQYLNFNVNSDCTVLRLNMLNSLQSLLTQLQSIFLNNSKTCQDNNIGKMINFCKELQKFVVENLNVIGNYQRKITTIKICKVMLDCLSILPKKRQKQGHSHGPTIWQMLKDKGCCILSENNFILKLLSLLRDSSDDVRENVVHLLLNHYSKELISKILISHLIEDALISARSKFFYQTNCARDMFKLITNILLKEKCNGAAFNNVEDVFQFAYKQIASEIEMKTDIVASIETGKQLHSIISILQVTLEVCNQNSYIIPFLEEHMYELVAMLEVVSNQFAWEQASSTSSDFSKMNDVVQGMIELSCYGRQEGDEAKISGLHQIVLNCLWLNVKASCELAALLVQFTKEEALVDKCLRIITRVLETCRHKGAIEAAGAALGRAIQYLTGLPDGSSLATLPRAVLECKLKALAGEPGAMASITRRGAGLSIMVHRIVASDAKKGKPLFHYFMETILEICKNLEDFPTVDQEEYADNQKDLPKAIYIHFLTRVVTDSSLASDMMYYSADLAELAFGDLTSPHWQIRNAALQLYGALIPKLIGQKKASGDDDETVATVACDEFRTHSPRLWTHIAACLDSSQAPNIVQAHSDLVPILNILANCARRYNFSFDTVEQEECDERLLKSLILLLESPVYTVRRLTAKCIYNIYSFDTIYDSIMEQKIASENFLHGILILLTNYYKNKYLNRLYDKQFNNLRVQIEGILRNGRHSYLCRQLYESIWTDNDGQENTEQVISEALNNSYEPGVFLWAEKRIEKHVMNTSWETLPQILKVLLEYYDYELNCMFILTKIKTNKDIPNDILKQMADQLLSFQSKFNSSVIWEVLYEISTQIDVKDLKVEITDILKQLQEKTLQYKLRFAIPFAVQVTVNTEVLLEISKIIYSLSDPDATDVDLRRIAALANNTLALSFEKLTDDIKIYAIKSVIILLQDEDEDIRSLSAHFFRNINNDTIVLHPYICLCKMLDYNFLNSIFLNPKESIHILCQELCAVLDGAKCGDIDEHNPFANDSKNIYIESDVVKQIIERINLLL